MSIYYDCIYRNTNPKSVSDSVCIKSWGNKCPQENEIRDHLFQMHGLASSIMSGKWLKNYIKINTEPCVDCSINECKKCGKCHTENCESRTICTKPMRKII